LASAAQRAQRDRDARKGWAGPASGHDRRVRWALVALPSAIGALAAVLIIAPMLARDEVSFTLAKDKVEKAPERMRVQAAQYRGEDDRGRPFRISAGGAVQATSATPIVSLNDLSAELVLDSGPATITAPTASYDMDRERIDVNGPLRFSSADGYKLDTANVGIDLKTRRMESNAPVTGSTRLGTFSAGRLRADLDARTVTLEGRARLHIVQGAARGR
jgi:lipopolysaccharide export system protein LptC